MLIRWLVVCPWEVRMKSKKWFLLIPAIALLAASCDSPTPSTKVPTEQQQSAANQEKLATTVPLPSLTNSLERVNISKRLQTFDNPNKVSYIYLINYGKVMAFYTIKGKVTSGNKRLTSNQKIVDSTNCGTAGNGGGYQCNLLMEQAELDGSYGTSAPYIFFWTTDGIYVQWSGDYMEVDQPLKLQQQPELIQEIK